MSFTDFLVNSSNYTELDVEAEATGPVVRDRNLLPPPFYINKLPLSSSLPPETQRWIKSAADERAAIEYGCRFSEATGDYVVGWIEENCKLYEGASAGELITLGDWQYDMYMQGFGWQWFDAEWEQRGAGLGWVRRYKIISGWIPKKNAKSPTLATLGLYMCLGDGEMGQKCFSLATTHDQAAISHTHALNFVRQSPLLEERCRINATTSTIFDPETNSTYSILSGDKNGQRTSKEGINGSLFIDETHVVLKAFMQVVDRAGISRRQPLKAQLSTSGQDTAGYGYEQYQLGQTNLKAADENRKFNFRFFHFEYSIPQSTSIADLRDPAKIEPLIRMANPTIGRIVRFTEAYQDWESSVRSDTELIKFAMYRLNQWNTGGGAFLALSDWQRCYKPFRAKSLTDYPCVAGIDMSMVRDMSALSIMWAVPKTIWVLSDILDPKSPKEEREINIPYVKTFYWVPKKSLHQYENSLDIATMVKRGYLRISESPSIRPEVIAEHLNYLDQNYDLRGVGMDPYKCKALSACLAATHGWDVDNKLFLIPQGAQHVSPAIEQLSSCVLAGELVQDGNEVTDWQLGNIVVVEDTHGNLRFKKTQHNDFRKIDGWASNVNSMFMMMSEPDMVPGSSLSIAMSPT